VAVVDSPNGGGGVGTLLRAWRGRRRRSQLDLALAAGLSTRHLSFLETGRSRPSREMVIRLANELEVPLRERNQLLLAAGYAPVYRQTPVDAPGMQVVRAALDRLLAGHEPYPAIIVDGGWNLVAANRSVAVLTEGVSPALLEPPVNVLRLTLHPEGMAPRVANLGELRALLLSGLRRQAAITGDPALGALHEELSSYPCDDPAPATPAGVAAEVALPLRLRTAGGELALLTTIATFGTAVDITLAELAVELFLPADEATADALARRHQQTG